MTACKPDYNKLIHAYELGILTTEEQKEFELHIMTCEICFNNLMSFRNESAQLREDTEIQSHIKKLSKHNNSQSFIDIKNLKWVVTTAAVLVLLLLAPWQIEFTSTDNIKAFENKLVLFDFENSQNPLDKNRYGSIASNLLISDLLNFQQLQIVSHQRILDVMLQLGLDQSSPLSSDKMIQVAQFLNARWIIAGSLVETSPQFNLSVQLIELPKGNITATHQIASSQGESIFSFIDKVSNTLRKDLLLVEDSSTIQDINIADMTTTSVDAYRYYLQGLDNYYKVYFDEATKNFEDAIAHDSKFAMAYYYLSKISNGQHIAKALAFSENLNQKEKLYIQSRYELLNYREDSSKALLKKLIQKYPDEKDAYYQLSRIYYYNESSYDSAIMQLSKALAIDPFYKPAHNFLVYSYSMLDNYEKAIIHIDKYIELDSLTANPYDTKGEINATFGKLDNAIESYKKALSIKPDFYSSVSMLGFMFLYKNDTKSADSCFQLLFNSDSNRLKSLARMYLTYAPTREGKYNLALKELQESIQLDIQDEDSSTTLISKYFQKAILLESAGQIEKAIVTMRTASKRMSLFPNKAQQNVRYYLIHLLYKNNEIKEANSMVEKYYDSIGKSKNYFFTYWYGKGMAAYVEKDYETAAKYFITSISITTDHNYPGYYVGHYMTALSYFYGNHHPEALELFEDLQTRYTSSRLFWSTWDNKVPYYVGCIYEKSNWNDKAIKQFEFFITSLKNHDTEIDEFNDATIRLKKLKSLKNNN